MRQNRPLATWDLGTDQTVDRVRFRGVPPLAYNRSQAPVLAIVIQTIRAESGRQLWKDLHAADWAVNALVDEQAEIRSLVADQHAPALKGVERPIDEIVMLSLGIIETADGVTEDQLLAAAGLVRQWLDVHALDQDDVISHGDLIEEDSCSCNRAAQNIREILFAPMERD